MRVLRGWEEELGFRGFQGQSEQDFMMDQMGVGGGQDDVMSFGLSIWGEMFILYIYICGYIFRDYDMYKYECICLYLYKYMVIKFYGLREIEIWICLQVEKYIQAMIYVYKYIFRYIEKYKNIQIGEKCRYIYL